MQSWRRAMAMAATASFTGSMPSHLRTSTLQTDTISQGPKQNLSHSHTHWTNTEILQCEYWCFGFRRPTIDIRTISFGVREVLLFLIAIWHGCYQNLSIWYIPDSKNLREWYIPASAHFQCTSMTRWVAQVGCMKWLRQPYFIQLIHAFAPNSAIVTYGMQLVFRVLQLLAIRCTQRNLCCISKS